MRLLIEDVVRRSAGWYVIGGLALVLVWSASRPFGGPQTAMALSMCAAFIIGPFAALTAMSSNAIRVAPVSRRDVWRSAWIAGVPVAAAVTTSAKVVAWLLTPRFMVAQATGAVIVLSTACDLLYTAASFGVLAMALAGSEEQWSSLASITRGTTGVLAMFTLLGFAGWGFVLRANLPTSLASAHVTVPSAMVLAIAIGLACLGYFQAPVSGMQRVQARLVRPAGADHATRPSSGTAIRRGFGGAPRLFFKESLTVLAGVAAAIGAVAIAETWMGDPRMVSGALQLFDEHASAMSVISRAGLVVPLVVMGPGVSFGAHRSTIRHLRTLPLSIAQVNAGRLLVCVAICSGLWALAVGAHLALLGTWPVYWRWDVLAVVTGIAVLFDALTFWSASRWSGLLVALPFVVAIAVVAGRSQGHETTFGVYSGCVACFVAAAALNQWTLRHSTRIYKEITPVTVSKSLTKA